jgi:hypothetical protein
MAVVWHVTNSFEYSETHAALAGVLALEIDKEQSEQLI